MRVSSRLYYYVILFVMGLSACSPAGSSTPAVTAPVQSSPPPATTNSEPADTPVSSTGTTAEDLPRLVPAQTVHAYPGPIHYEGDVLTFEVMANDSDFDEPTQVALRLDGGKAFDLAGQFKLNYLVVPLALDTTGLTGHHTLELSSSNGPIKETYSFDVLPASERPPLEQNNAWLLRMTPCCILHYISNTAAARDIDFIAERFQKAAEDFSQFTGQPLDKKLEAYFIDRIWGNGGFGGNGELVVSYTDRYYGPTVDAIGLETLARHEFTHAAGVGGDTDGDGVDFNYEGLAVYVAGGHYKPEPLAQRGGALYDLGYFVPVGDFLGQHELDYLYPAAMLTYISKTYGPDAVWKLLSADNTLDEQIMPLDVAVQSTFGIPMSDFNENFRTWLDGQDSGAQLEDLRLTIKLQDLRRQYQDTYIPPPFIIFGMPQEAVAHQEYLPIAVREAQAPANAAIELLIANGQAAIVAGDYPAAEQWIDAIENVLSAGKFETPLAKDYLELTSTLMQNDYFVDSLELQENHATAQVAKGTLALFSLELQKTSDHWEILP